MLTEQLGSGQQAAVSGPEHADLPGGMVIGHLEVPDGLRLLSRRPTPECGHEGHPEASGHETLQREHVIALQVDVRLETRLSAQLVTQPPQG